MDRRSEQLRRALLDPHGRWTDRPALGMAGEAADAPVARRHDTTVRVGSTADGYVVLADPPGLERDEIDLRYRDGELTLSATHEVAETRTAEDGRGEAARRRRRVDERVRVPAGLDPDAIPASYWNGVLEVHLPGDVVDPDPDATPIDVE